MRLGESWDALRTLESHNTSHPTTHRNPITIDPLILC